MNIDKYKSELTTPWGELFYKIIFQQLGNLENQKVLDFGAGFGITSDYLAKNNEVLAVDNNKEIILHRKQTNSYQYVLGDVSFLSTLPAHSFDIILCHNVLEYINIVDHDKYLFQFERLLKPQGKLSIIKHHKTGKILQSIVFENDILKAQKLLNNDAYESMSIGTGISYTLDHLKQKTSLIFEKYQGIRMFYGLQSNLFKQQTNWMENLLTMEMEVCEQSPYKDIAFFHHIWLRKE